MDTTIVIPFYNRPQYLLQTLRAWNNVRGIDDLNVDILLYGDGATQECEDIANDWALGRVGAKTINGSHVGWPLHSMRCLDYGSARSFMILAEDDVLPSEDAIEFMRWAAKNFRLTDVAAICAFNENVYDSPPATERSVVLNSGKYFRPLLWGTWPNRWDHFRKDWDTDYRYRGWDWHLGIDLIPNSPWPWIVRPAKSRSQHIGEEGLHCYAAIFQETTSPTFSFDGEPSGPWNPSPHEVKSD